MAGRSEAWKFFDRTNPSEAKCKTCSSVIKCKGSTTSALINHLKTHQIEINKKSLSTNNVEATSPKKRCIQPSMQEFVKRDSLNKLLARCAAKDGFSFRSITRSLAIQEFILKRGYLMPKSEITVKNHVFDFAQEMQDNLKVEITKLTSAENKFSITVDEWTDINIKRYLNVTLHDGKTSFKLGLIEIRGSCNADTTQELVEKKLLQFGLSFKDIVASTHDGAAVMKKYGRIIPAESQTCFNHAIHLAVMDVFYKKVPAVNYTDEELDETFDEFNDEDEDIEIDKTADNDCNINFQLQVPELIPNLRPDIKKVLAEARKLVKYFKYSTVRNPILLEHVKHQENKELRLLLDCKTRWNSLVPMIERLLKLKQCLKQALIEFGTLEMYYNEHNFHLLEEILEVLKPLELGVNALSKDDATLLTCEGVFKFMFLKLRNMETDLSQEMLNALKQRFSERRNKELVSLMKYLHGGANHRDESFEEFTYSTKAASIAFAKKMTTRLFNAPAIIESSSICEAEPTPGTSSMALELKNSIDSVTLVRPSTRPETLSELQKEFKLFEATDVRTPKLEKLLQALVTIQPTSTCSERVFSVAGCFSTKVRNRLSYKMLNALVFLKYYFTSEN